MPDVDANAPANANVSTQRPWFERPIVAPLVSFLMSLVAFAPGLRNGFVQFDDPHHITDNDAVKGGLSWEFVKWAFSDFHFANYHPMVWLSHALDVTLFGLEPMGHHAMSLLMHATSAALIAIVVSMLTERPLVGLVTGVLFAVHPQHVESVSWASERKDVLSGVFFAALLLSYVVAYRRQRPALLVLSFVLFALGLLAKPMLVTVPPLLLVLDVLLLRRRVDARVLLEKAPFALGAALFALLTMRAQASGNAINDWPLTWRLGNAFVSTARYVAQTIWPVDLSPYYRFPLTGWPVAFVIGGVVTVVAITIIVTLVFVRYRTREPLAGWLWFCGMLVPVIGIVKVGLQAMADRYMYLPHIGLFLVVGVALDAYLRKHEERARVLAVACGVVVVALVLRTHDQIKVWSDTRTLWKHAIAVEPNNAWAHYFLADIALGDGDVATALESMRLAALEAPNTLEILERLARVEMIAGNDARAEPLLRAIVQSDPTRDVATFLLAEVCRQRGRSEEAHALFVRAVGLAQAKGHNDLAERARIAAAGGAVTDLSEPRKPIL